MTGLNIVTIFGIIIVILGLFTTNHNTDIKTVRLEMCKKDAKCVYSPEDIPSDMVREYYKNK